MGIPEQIYYLRPESQQRCVSYEIPEDTPFPEAMNNPLGRSMFSRTTQNDGRPVLLVKEVVAELGSLIS